ncbi:tRNA (adenosine(37)-N6)-threonylcarbamoyltransferase complex ATPase subunit type 1 TsaE [bacterium]|nr:MAG: tRNA (adenosine(37)-N6)-threonylcarbamoyltransferase complex ATPase subunit type 1 TsaE [bacterium]
MQFAQKWASQHLKSGDVVCLRGDLGAGKTHFVKGLIQAFGGNEVDVNSPTFTLIHEYRKANPPIYHFDCYRLKSEAEAIEIGIEDYLYGDGICCIEWPERIEGLLPSPRYEIEIKHKGENKREIVWKAV